MTGLDHVRRWAETVLVAALALYLLYRGLTAAWAGAWLGGLAAFAGLLAAGWAFAAYGRARFDAPRAGSGMVEIAERRVAFFGPLGGGAVALDELVAVDAARDALDAPAWRLRDADGVALIIPLGAAGAEALPEALSALPGFSLDRAAAAFADPPSGPMPLWRRRA
ncbi:MAG: hypothetical protein AAF763_06705 [Pseudomonadota bacterium]